MSLNGLLVEKKSRSKSSIHEDDECMTVLNWVPSSFKFATEGFESETSGEVARGTVKTCSTTVLQFSSCSCATHNSSLMK